MRLNGMKILTRGEDWIEVEAPDGSATLRGYDPALIEYESLDEAKREKTAEIRARVVSEADAVMPVWEFIYITRARISDSRVTTLEAIARKGRDLEAQVQQATTVEEVQAITW